MLQPPPLPRTLDASVRDLGSRKADVRASAIADLVRHARGDDAVRGRAIPLLEKALGDEAHEVRAAAAVALADLAAKEALPKLLVTVEDADVYVRQMALNALGEIGDARALPRLRRALDDARPEVRYQAIIAFVRVVLASDEGGAGGAGGAGARDGAHGEARDAVAKATRDDDDAVRYIALRLAEERVRENDAWRALADRAETMLDDTSKHVAIAAAILLAKLGRGAGRELLLRIVRGDVRAEKEDEREAVQMAGELGLDEAKASLERRAFGALRFMRDTCAFEAKIALARMGHERAVAAITKDLASPKRAACEAAVVAAGRARLVALAGAVEALGDDRVAPELRREALAALARGRGEGRSA